MIVKVWTFLLDKTFEQHTVVLSSKYVVQFNVLIVSQINISFLN